MNVNIGTSLLWGISRAEWHKILPININLNNLSSKEHEHLVVNSIVNSKNKNEINK